jgi:hypothetical protein
MKTTLLNEVLVPGDSSTDGEFWMLVPIVEVDRMTPAPFSISHCVRTVHVQNCACYYNCYGATT